MARSKLHNYSTSTLGGACMALPIATVRLSVAPDNSTLTMQIPQTSDEKFRTYRDPPSVPLFPV